MPNKGISTFNYTYSIPSENVEQTIQQFLAANKFTYSNGSNGPYWYYNDIMYGKGGLTYTIMNGYVEIHAWIGTEKKPYQIDDSFAGAIAKQHFIDMLSSLQSALTGQSVGQNMSFNDNASINNQFNDAISTRNGKMAVISFVISIIMLAVSCLGVLWGAFIYAINIWLAVQGLKSPKKGLSIAALTITGIGLVIGIIMIVLNYI